jgi:hypothetical protein
MSWNTKFWEELGSLRAYVEENDLDNAEVQELMRTIRDELNQLLEDEHHA